MNEGGEIVGMVDVLKLTYATLEQVREHSAHVSKGLPLKLLFRSTQCRPKMMKGQLGTSSGCQWTTSPIRWFPEARATNRIGQ